MLDSLLGTRSIIQRVNQPLNHCPRQIAKLAVACSQGVVLVPQVDVSTVC